MRKQIIFERYGRAALGKKFPYLRVHLKKVPETESDLLHLCKSYGAALALRDQIKKQSDCDPDALEAVEARCEELEAEATWLIEPPQH